MPREIGVGMSYRFVFWLKTVSVLISGALLVSVFGFGCGMGFLPAGYYSGSSIVGELSDVGDNLDLVVVSGKRTVSVTYHDQVLENMKAATGVAQVSNATLNTFQNRLGTFSEYGFASSVNAPMLLSITQLAAEVCADLLAQESQIAIADRSYYTNIDFAQTLVNFDDAKKSQLIRRFARSFWQRNETAEELSYLLGSLNTMLSLATDNDNNRSLRNRSFRLGYIRSGLFLCSTMLSSTNAIEI